MKFLKLFAISYAIKTLLIGAAWIAIPDLPQRARTAAQHAWTWVSSSPKPDLQASAAAVAPAEPGSVVPVTLPVTR
jgi:hypothetical protein